MSAPRPNRVLFVDDEPGLRETIAAILRCHDFEVHTAATVGEALNEIASRPFDVLISDLNIGQPGDGFTVVSAMRRTQPECVTFILTGYPAFETALHAIRAQVDDYLIKPTAPAQLVKSIEDKLLNRRKHQPMPLMRLSALLRERSQEIIQRMLMEMQKNPQIRRAGLNAEQLVNNLPKVLSEIADQLDSTEPVKTDFAVRYGKEHGHQRRCLRYTAPMLLDDADILDGVIYQVVQESLLALDISHLITDLRRLNHSLQVEVKESIRAFLEPQQNAA